jgi:hypothetical protein
MDLVPDPHEFPWFLDRRRNRREKEQEMSRSEVDLAPTANGLESERIPTPADPPPGASVSADPGAPEPHDGAPGEEERDEELAVVEIKIRTVGILKAIDIAREMIDCIQGDGSIDIAAHLVIGKGKGRRRVRL